MSRIDLRLASAKAWEDLARQRRRGGRSALWARIPDLLEPSAAALAILGDYVPFGIGQALGAFAGGNSLDNTLRVVRIVPTEWVLLDIQVDGIDQRLRPRHRAPLRPGRHADGHRQPVDHRAVLGRRAPRHPAQAEHTAPRPRQPQIHRNRGAAMTYQGYGMTIPFEGVPLHEQRRLDRASWPTSATPTCGRARPTAPTGSPRWRWPRCGRRRCGSARPSSRRSPGARPPWPSAWPRWPTPRPGRVAFGIGTSSNVIVERWNDIPFEEPYKKTRDMVRFLRTALTGEKVKADYDTFSVNGFKLGARARAAAQDPRSPRSARGCCGWPGARATAPSSTGSAPTTCATVAPVRARGRRRQGGRGPDLRGAHHRRATWCGDWGRCAIAAYLTVPVYAEFHRWLGRGELLQPMWDALGGRRPQGRARPPSPTSSSTR